MEGQPWERREEEQLQAERGWVEEEEGEVEQLQLSVEQQRAREQRVKQVEVKSWWG